VQQDSLDVMVWNLARISSILFKPLQHCHYWQYWVYSYQTSWRLFGLDFHQLASLQLRLGAHEFIKVQLILRKYCFILLRYILTIVPNTICYKLLHNTKINYKKQNISLSENHQKGFYQNFQLSYFN